MDALGWTQIILLMGLLALTAKPLGIYIARIYDPNGKTFLDPVFRPLEGFIYRFMGVKRDEEQNWKEYAVAIMIFTGFSSLVAYGIFRCQQLLPLNPQGFGGMSPDLSFNTAVSFATNTDWQAYSGENTLSNFSQMTGIQLHMFFSAAAGMAVVAALIRGLSRVQGKTLGCFWVDITRIIVYLLLPLSLVLSLFFLQQGMPQSLHPFVQASLVEPIPAVTGVTPTAAVVTQTIPMGFIASQSGIKILGLNGGGFFGANSAHPFENPTPLTNFVTILMFVLIPSALFYTFGYMMNNRKHGWALWIAAAVMFVPALLISCHAEIKGSPHLAELNVASAPGNMEGKEQRIGVLGSAIFASGATSTGAGANNCMYDSLTPLGGLVNMFNIQLGEVVYGGIGSGLYGLLIFVIITMMIAGLMVGRTPEYLGKKIEAYDVKMVVIAQIVFIFCILGFSSWAVVAPWGLAGMGNNGPHGWSEVLYAYTSTAANNGTAFGGLTVNTWQYNVTLALSILFGRMWMKIPVLALAGSMVKKKVVAEHAGSFPVHGFTFIFLLVAIVVIVGALTFFPADALGPIAEHFVMTGSKVLY
jgi:K+-transporting ATPase ATPase A chain